jgi:hypothetical protein
VSQIRACVARFSPVRLNFGIARRAGRVVTLPGYDFLPQPPVCVRAPLQWNKSPINFAAARRLCRRNLTVWVTSS